MLKGILNMIYEWLFQVWWAPSKNYMAVSCDVSSHTQIVLMQATAIHQPQQPCLFHHESPAAKPYASS